MKRKLITSLLLTSALFAGCGSSSSYESSYASYDTTETAAYSGSATYLEGNEVSYEEGADTEVTGEKLVYRGSITMETLDFTTTVNSIHEQLEKYNGIIESEEQTNSNYYWYEEDSTDYRRLYITIRIPTKDFNTFLNELEGDGHITSKSQSVENITKQYNSNALEIESLQTQEKRLLEMMEVAETVEDLITIDARLSEVQTQMMKLQNYQSQMDNDVEYSTIYISVEEVRKYTPIEYEKYPISGFGEKLVEAFDTSWRFCVWAVQNFIITLIELLPLGVVVVAVVIGIRKLIKKLKERKQK